MRVILASLLALSACGPKVNTKPISYDEDLGGTKPPEVATVTEEVRPEAPRGKGERSGTIERARLVAVLDQGPAAFLRQLEVTPRMTGERFVGWQLVQLLDGTGPLVAVDLVPGDVLLAVNGRPLSRPDQLQSLWDSLRTSNEVVAQMWRGAAKFELHYAIEPKVAATEAPMPPAELPAKPAPAPPAILTPDSKTKR